MFLLNYLVWEYANNVINTLFDRIGKIKKYYKQTFLNITNIFFALKNKFTMGILSYIKSIILGKEETTQNNQTLPADTKVVVEVSETKVEEPKVEVIEEKLPEVITENPVVNEVKEVDPNKGPKSSSKKRPSPKKKSTKLENKTEKPKKSKNTKK